MKEKIFTAQDWIEVESILNNGIIKLKNNKYIKLIKIMPINFNLKSNFEKQVILNSYKTFLKTCNFDIQILIQSNKKDLQKSITNIEENLKKENKEFLTEIGKNYILFINKINSLKNSGNKDFYVIISHDNSSENNVEDLIYNELNDNYFKIKECLQRCGNIVKNINSKKEAEKILLSFFNTRLFLL